jgi:mono/diheme cytochrome c family protein
MKEHRRRPRRGMPFRNGPSAAKASNWRATTRAFVVLVLLVSLFAGVAVYSIVSRGLSTHDEPSRIEEMLARTMRRWATPRSMRDRASPIEPKEMVLEQALAHYADHCATCHANDGSGDTEIGRALYPRVPDMRADSTQSLTDGELFSIIEHGIRLTGMPGWGNGTPEGERESWGLVHFVRRLPKLSDEDIARMEALNPKSPEAWREEEEARRFLAGEDVKRPEAAPHKHERNQQ